ncbi:MAG TPA: response regulator [Bacteroidia bacterium]|nr:response regulator [Bacteroidia bacterium]
MASKILIADDEPDLELIISQKFRSRISKGELKFEFAENGAIALEKLQADPTFDLVFTDINMPVMDGLTLLGKIKDHEIQSKAVVISAYGDVRNIRTAMNRGAFDFIIKPIDLEDLDLTLSKALKEIEILKQGIEAKNKLEIALIEKAKAQQEALHNLLEKEKLILQQNEMLELQVKERTLEIQHQKELIEVKNREILDSIYYAKRLQEAILPNKNLLTNLFPESFILYYPKDIVAGDFYWLGTGSRAILAIADCTGHGVSGALMSMLGMSLLNQLVNGKKITDPAILLDLLHVAVVEALNQKENDSNEGMDIAICCFDEQSNSFHYAGANRPLWLIRKGELITYPADKMPIGGVQIQNRPSFTNHTLQLHPGDRIYLSTDGYADQFGGEFGKKMMTKNLKELLSNSSDTTMHDQGIMLHDFFEKWKGNHEQVDDVLMMGIEIK